MHKFLARLALCFSLIALAGSARAAPAAAHVEVTEAGAVTYIDADGASLSVVAEGGQDPVLAPDGSAVAFIRTDDHGGDGTALWLYDTRTHAQRRLLRAHRTENNETNLRGLNHPNFSPDGRTIYVQSLAWVTSDALFRVDRATGAHHFVAAANSLLVMRDGPYVGDLLISEHAYHPEGGSYEQLLLLKPTGAQVMKVPGTAEDTDDAGPWLQSHGWHAW